MEALITAIQAQWRGNAALFSSLTGGMHLGRQPSEKTQPYCVVTIEETPWWTFDHNFESYVINFFLYSKEQSPATLLSIYTKLKAAFDEAERIGLVVDGYHVIRFWRLGSTPIQQVDVVWVLTVQYSCELEQTA